MSMDSLAAMSEIASIALTSLKVASAATLICLPVGIALGYWLSRTSIRLKWIIEALLMLPMVVPPVATGLLILLALSPSAPWAWLWQVFGFDTPLLTWWSAALASALVGFPLLMRSCKQAFVRIDESYETLAATMGISPRHIFLRITLPMARHGVILGATLCFARALGEFGATVMVAGNIPGHTETLATGIYSRVMQGEDASAAFLAGISVVLAFASVALGHFVIARRYD